MMTIMTALAVGYLLGSIPFGLILAKAAGYGDIRKIGSGNIGTTNVLRTGNKKLALLTLICDGGKGAAAALLINYILGYDMALVAGFAAVLGHLYPVWLKFKGGKGVATTLGTLLAVSPLVGALACLTWLVMAFTFKYSSLSALTAMLLSPVYAFFLIGYPNLTALCGILALLVWIKHRANIHRLVAGEEPKIGQNTLQVTGTRFLRGAAGLENT